MNLVALFLSTLTLIYVISRFKGCARSNPVIGASLFQYLMAAGILLSVDHRFEADSIHIWLILTCNVLMLVGARIYLFGNEFSRLYQTHFSEDIDYSYNSTTGIFLWGMIFISILISAYYFSRVGYILFLDALRGFVTGEGSGDFATRRLAAYADMNSYLGAGYVNQFKNVLLPLCVFIVATHDKMRFGRVNPLIWILAPTAFVFILGTGQKGAFVQICICFMFILILLSRSNNLTRPVVQAALSLALLVGFISILQGRADAGFSGDGLSSVVASVYSRVFESNQQSALIGFRYMYDVGIQWGNDWYLDFLGLTPGHRGSSLASIIYSIFYVTDRGNAPPSNWGSAYYNFGFFGAAVFAVIYGLAIAYLYRRYIAGPRTLLRCSVYGFLFGQFSFWIAASPVQLINNGVVTAIILKLLLNLTEGGSLFSRTRTDRRDSRYAA